ncbi:MAG: hypothetical protein EOM21_15895 [Gammaproteobacteria bacterium]|nr:hypothetical protein [Gammaproteobacteria bacterium]
MANRVLDREPLTRVVYDPKPAPFKPSKRVGTRAKYAKIGRTSGLPWDTTVQINQSTDLDNGPARRPERPKNWHARIESAIAAGDHAAVVSIGRTVLDTLEKRHTAVHKTLNNLIAEHLKLGMVEK